jgi:hypothetical protein
MIKTEHEVGEFYCVNVTLIICKHGQYTPYRSRDHKTL